MPLNTKKDFWVKVINDLKDYKNPTDLNEGNDWEIKLRAKATWREIEDYAMAICQDIFDKATENQDAFPVGGLNPLLNYMGANTSREYRTNIWDTVYAYEDLANVLRDKIGVDPEDNTLATDDAGNNIKVNGVDIPQWKHAILKKLPKTLKLTDIPGNMDLTDLLYHNDLYQEIMNARSGLMKDILIRDLTDASRVDKYGFNWQYKINRVKVQEYKDAAADLLATNNNIKTILGLDPADPLPNNWHFLLVKMDDLFNANNTIDALTAERDGYKTERDNYKTKSDEYDRIHTKLSGKVSNSELDTLLNPPSPQCSHTDYDTIKSERDQLKTDKENHNCDCDNKVKAKESEIITKIITDLGLATERERENVLEAVITEIRAKITPPTDKSKELSEKQSKITELESQIKTLQNPKSLKDLSISSEIKSEIIKVSQELGLTKQSCAKLEKATSYQELSTLQKEAFQEKLTSEANDKKSAQQLNYGLGALCLGSLLILAYMIIKTTSLPIAGKKEEKK